VGRTSATTGNTGTNKSEDEDDADKSDDEDNANSSSSTPLIDRRRRENIKRNQERFEALGLLDATKEIKKLANQKKKNTEKILKKVLSHQ